jgi:glycosyltransferase involved in cell wall biosynthesis
MRILQLTKRYWPHRGGVERHVRDLATGLVATGEASVEVLVAADRRESRGWNDDGVRVTTVPAYGRPLSLDLAPGYLRAVGQALALRPDVIHLHEPHPLGLLAWAWYRHRMPPLVVTWHADIVRQRLLLPAYGPAQRWILHEAKAVITPTERHVTASAFLPTVADKCHVVPFGVDVARYIDAGAATAGDAMRRTWGNPARVVLFVGRLIYYKGLPVLLDAMAGIDGTLVLAGEGRDRAALEAQAARLGIAGRTHFLGDVPESDLAALYHACDVFVLPSTAITEGFGLVQLEAMACGKPVVSTRLPTGVAVVNRHGVTGLTVPPGDVGALGDALNRLLHDRALATAYGTMARRRVLESFSRERMVADTFALYRSVTSR